MPTSRKRATGKKQRKRKNALRNSGRLVSLTTIRWAGNVGPKVLSKGAARKRRKRAPR